MPWVIQSTREFDEETEQPLYWSNEDGWVDIHSATVFTDDEKIEQSVHDVRGPGRPMLKSSIWREVAFPQRRNSRMRHNPPLPEHMAHDNLDQIAKLLAERFVSDVVEGATPHNYSRFVRKLSRTVYEEVEARADDRLSDDVQEALSDLGEMAGRLGMKHW